MRSLYKCLLVNNDWRYVKPIIVNRKVTSHLRSYVHVYITHTCVDYLASCNGVHKRYYMCACMYMFIGPMRIRTTLTVYSISGVGRHVTHVRVNYTQLPRHHVV